MASLTMMASFLGTSRPSIGHHRSVVVTTAAARAQDAAAKPNHYEARGDNENSGRRGVVFAAAAAAVCAIGQGIATAAEEPKPGTPEAKKKYAPICVTMPTAKICHK